MNNRTLSLDDALYGYLIDASLRESPLLRRLREETSRMAEVRFQIAPEQGQFMALLVRLMGARRALEIGVFTGYSALVTAAALPPDGQLVACDINAQWTQIAQQYWREAGVANRIDLRLAPAAQTLEALLADGQEGRFDFAFIDADKPAYERYYELTLKLLRRGGLIAFDNTLWNGAVADPSVHDENTDALRRLNEKLRDDRRVDLSLVPIGDGLTLALKR
ncbi:MAG TPA: class I SAM-dependent methyltransferase [Gammaproteobacteria bacterium]|nr:class I SAM-dependent methyltransferase [Gammaproteobacteria bacterium]